MAFPVAMYGCESWTIKKGAAAAAAAAKSLQSCLTLFDSIDGSPPGSPIPEILHARTLEWIKKGWVPMNWCFWIMVLEKILESPLDSKDIKPANPEWNQSWIFIGRTDAEAESPIIWPPDMKSQFNRKEPDAGKDWRQEMGNTEEEVGWQHWLNGYFEQILGDAEGQGSLVCCSPRGCKVRHDWVTEKQK